MCLTPGPYPSGPEGRPRRHEMFHALGLACGLSRLPQHRAITCMIGWHPRARPGPRRPRGAQVDWALWAQTCSA